MAPPVVYQSDAINHALSLPIEDRKAMVTKISIQQGAFAATQVAAVWLPAITYLSYGKARPAKFFQTGLNASAKTAFTIMPIVMGFGLVSEQVASRLANPQAFEAELSHGRVSSLSVPKRLANFFLDSPMKALIMIGVPGVLGIFLAKGGQSELSFSQRIMHTRVMGQFSVLAVLVGTMGFHDYMTKRGRFLEVWEEEALAKQKETAPSQ
jgi:hypothetical protein